MGNSSGRSVNREGAKVEGRQPLGAAKRPAKSEEDEFQILEMPQKRGWEASGLPRKRVKMTTEERTAPIRQEKYTESLLKGAGSIQAKARIQDVRTSMVQEGTRRLDKAAVDANAGFDDLMKNLQARVQSFKTRESELENRLKAAEERAHEMEGRSLEAEGRAHKMEGRALKAEQKIHEVEGGTCLSKERVQRLERRVLEAEKRAQERVGKSLEELKGCALKAEERMKEMEGWAVNAEERVQGMEGRALESEEKAQQMKRHLLEAEGSAERLEERALKAEEKAQRSEERALKAEEEVVKLQAELETLREEKKTRPRVNLDMGKGLASIADLLLLPKDQKRTPKAEAAFGVPGSTAGLDRRSSAQVQTSPLTDAQNQVGSGLGVQKIAPEKGQGTPKPAVEQAGTSADDIDHVTAKTVFSVVGPQGGQGMRANVESAKVAGHNQQNEMLLQPHLMREGPGLFTEAQWTFLAKEARVFAFATIFG